MVAKNNASVNVIGGGETPLNIAISMIDVPGSYRKTTNPELVKLLLEHRADPNLSAKDYKWVTALFRLLHPGLDLMSKWTALDIARMLVAAKADPNVSLENGQTLYEMAKERAPYIAELFKNSTNK